MPKKLPPGTPYLERFKAGEEGHSHVALEAIVWGSAFLLTWLVTPLAGLFMMVLLYIYADEYWFNREIRQSIRMKRTPKPEDYDRDLENTSDFWTDDAKKDVKSPRKVRKIWYGISGPYLFWMFTQVGFLGVIFP